jgi:Helix-hairpin-helix motif
MRTDGVKRNQFIHPEPLPPIALDPHPDLYRLFIDQETSSAFLPTELKNGQEMMASEGTIATLFYRIVNDGQLRKHYLKASFYQRFLGGDVEAPEQAITPYENVNLKLFASMEKLQNVKGNRPPMIDLVEQYAKLFPEEAKRICAIFIETTWGATVSRQLASGLERAAADGGRGDITAFRQDHPFQLLDSIIAQVMDRKIALDAGLGPELWVANTAFKIAPAVWGTKRSEPLTMNLNTASVAERMTVPGVDVRIGRRIIEARDARGVFRSIDELREAGAPTAVIARLREMQIAMAQLGDHKRK